MQSNPANVSLQKRHFYFEYILAGLLLSQNICLYFSSHPVIEEYSLSTIFWIIFIIFMIQKHLTEGYRGNTFALVLAELFLLVAAVHPTTGFEIIANILALVYLWSISFFVTYKIPEPTGPYQVGYKLMKIGEDGIASIWYPTDEKTRDDTPWQEYPDYWKTMHEVTNTEVKLPKILVALFTTHLAKVKLGVNNGARLLLHESQGIKKDIEHKEGLNQQGHIKKFPVIIFVHGLAAHINFCSALLKELASHGVIVFSVGNRDKVLLKKENREERRAGLLQRVKRVQMLLDLLHNDGKSTFLELFPEAKGKAELDLDNLHILGHSYGGATALYSASIDERITGHALLLDPWFYPLPDDLDLSKVKNPFLCITSETFDTNFKRFRNRELMQSLWKYANNREIVKKSFKCTIKNSGHNNISDMAFLMPGECKITGMINGLKDCYEQFDVVKSILMNFVKEYAHDKFHMKEAFPEKYKDMILVMED